MDGRNKLLFRLVPSSSFFSSFSLSLWVRRFSSTTDSCTSSPDSKTTNIEPSVDLTQCVLFRDSNYIAINKPYGLPTVGASKTQDSVMTLIHQLKFNNEYPPMLLHRLAKDITGALMLARSKDVAVIGMQLIERRTFWTRRYWAVVCGRPIRNSGEIRIALGSYADTQQRYARAAVFPLSVSHGGQQAVTEWRVIASRHTKLSPRHQRVDEELARWLKKRVDEKRKTKTTEEKGDIRGELCLIELTTVTGFKHQIRAHCAYGLGCAIYGDTLYSSLGQQWSKLTHTERPSNAPPGRRQKLHLHSREIQFHRFNGKAVTVRAPLPPHMAATFRTLGWGDLQEERRAEHAQTKVQRGEEGSADTARVKHLTCGMADSVEEGGAHSEDSGEDSSGGDEDTMEGIT
eukprot:GHVS01086041.1.p1 GENE.GHVS01086041.1~~GHVS01086041.1.p1  ORF type:complete len:402 (-),score=57.54 GHVS01086041.1:397-1602(-)